MSMPHVADPITWLADPADAQRRARERRAPVLVDFWDPECLGCLKMLAETFPDRSVATLLEREFVCVKVDTEAVTAPQRELVRAYRVLWTPDLLFLDPTGAELGRRIGFHEPEEFLAVLRIVLGQTAMLYRDYTRAREHFLAAATSGARMTRPEARFWAGIAAFKIDGTRDRSILRREWRVLAEEHADTPWLARAAASWGVEAGADRGVTAAV